MGFFLPVSESMTNLPVRGPKMAAPTAAATPPTIWTAVHWAVVASIAEAKAVLVVVVVAAVAFAIVDLVR